MEKSCHPSSGNSKSSANPTVQISAAAATSAAGGGSSTNSVQNSLRQLNKGSYKISKPTSKHRSGGVDGGGDSSNPSSNKPQPPSLPPPAAAPAAAAANSQQPLPQPPVYNINKNDFREVVQKLTGSPAHQSRLSSPAVAPQRENPKPAAPPAGGAASIRLQKIRPPPLAQLTPRPRPPLIPAADHLPAPMAGLVGGNAWPRSSPLSPLPPLPTVSAAAESPISAYMRCLQSGSVAAQQALIPSPGGISTAAPLLPLAPPSPLVFGCMPSPWSAYEMMLSPGLLFPPSPGVPMPSPRWRDQ